MLLLTAYPWPLGTLVIHRYILRLGIKRVHRTSAAVLELRILFSFLITVYIDLRVFATDADEPVRYISQFSYLVLL